MKRTERNMYKLIIALLSLGIVCCIAVSVWALFFRESSVVLTPDYAPQESESNAEPIPDDNGEKPDVEEGGGAISVEYTDIVTVILSDKKAELEYANPGRSTHDIILQVVVKDEVIIQSGLIKPGNRVKELPLLKGAEDLLSEGVYNDCTFRILSYDPETGEKSMIDTEAKITVTVTK